MKTQETAVQRVLSPDGTAIAVEQGGYGPPLVIVVGTWSDRRAGGPLARRLAESYTVYNYDRRGRGDSGDGRQYAVEREIEDLAAVIEAVGSPPYVYGQSTGGILALEAAARGLAMRRIAVYEPPYCGHDPGPRYLHDLDLLCASGGTAEAAESFLVLNGATPRTVAAIKQGPRWSRMQALAHTLSRDVRLVNGGVVPVRRFARVAVPVLALVGAESPIWAHQATRTLEQVIAQSEARVIAGERDVPDEDALSEALGEFFAVEHVARANGQAAR